MSAHDKAWPSRHAPPRKLQAQLAPGSSLIQGALFLPAVHVAHRCITGIALPLKSLFSHSETTVLNASIRNSCAAALATALTLVPLCAHSEVEPDNYRVRIGYGHVAFSESATLRLGGNVVPGASAHFSNGNTLLIELGYRLTPQWSANLTFGVPPKTKATGTGTASVLGKVGEITYGPMALTGQYQWEFGRLRPYVGAGLAYNIVFKSDDGSVSGLNAKSSGGTVAQLGVEYALMPKVGLFVDVKKVWLKTTATGTVAAMGNAPAHADITLNPIAIQVGLSYSF